MGMGDKFKDFASIDWDKLIPREDRLSTLIVLDDHQSVMKRTKELLDFGFVHLWYDDNNNGLDKPVKYFDNYAFNAVCAPLPPGVDAVHYGDKHGGQAWGEKPGAEGADITPSEHEAHVEWMLKHIEVYQEIPPLLDGCG